MSVADQIGNMQPASFRGVPFAVLQSETRFGRRLAVHDYPYRDKPWAEDLGRSTRKFAIQGFIITDSWVYGGGDVFDQRDSLVGAVETAGAGTLIHPTLGRLQVSIPEDGLIVSEGLDAQRYMEFTLLCYEDGARTFPAASAAEGDDLDSAADDVDAGAAGDYVASTGDDFDFGTSVFEAAQDVATDWASMLFAAADDATGVFNLAASLPGQYGRFFNGALAGYAQALLPGPVLPTLVGLIFAASQLREGCRVAGAGLVAASLSEEPAGVPAAAANAAASLVAAISNPADGVRLCVTMANFFPATLPGTSPVSLARSHAASAMGTLLRRTALASLCRVVAAYQPQSTEDANALRLQVCDLIDAEAVIAGDLADDASFNALSAARANVAADLDTRGAKLPPMRDFNFGASAPALALAYRIYQDTGRHDELVALANPAHPAFMPLAFKALAS